MFDKKTVQDIDVKGKTVLLHGEFDAPLNAAGTEVTSDFRVAASLPTIKYLQAQGCKIVLISKLGRPGGKVDATLSLRPVAACLRKLTGQEVAFVDDCVGEEVRAAAKALQPGQLLLLENLRFHPEEEANDETFARQLAADTAAQIFVDDCFALAHRKEAGNAAIAAVLPGVAGLHLAKEIETIQQVMHEPQKPLAAIIGGAKIADKIDILNKFLEIADFVAVGGAMANTFLAARGVHMGKSKYDADELDLARDIMERAEEAAKTRRFVFYVPEDVVVARAAESNAATRLVDFRSALIAEVQNYPKQPPAEAQAIAPDEMMLDIGPFSAAFIAGGVQLAATVIWNGTLGVTEIAPLAGAVGPFAHATEVLIEALTGEFGARPFTLVGGGDTTGYLEQRHLTNAFNHVSTGGGASLELMAGHALPAVEALQTK